ncbi:LysR family transcriptional regulator [Cognatishimia sp. 1_MG-2023]|uniref:LysR family transcriptional regulator n=1 Tax=Cognatishimia sp. 1_MG-2023 TaxID=3062642 RepID=UPI0026E149BF|nr:LysR family transcriptional regulator [Cognatishimia sp. 1_MG-2023]MDO6728268.1 LysR family transcriptional regulator [Cognatishimia sp. 1_MG-2023]
MFSLRHLNALRAFEAAARLGSFASAGRELNVSPSVVSTHVKNLEQWFGTELFVRSGNGIVLSADGHSLIPQISTGFQSLRDGCNGLLKSTQRGTLTVVAEPALASLWLRSRLTEFCNEFPNIEVDLRPSWSPPTLEESHSDIVIHFDTRQPTGGVERRDLFPIDGFPACTPELKARLVGDDGQIDWRNVPLVHDNGREIWCKWFTEYVPDSTAWQQGHVYSNLALAIDAAKDGEGLVLADRVLCERAFASGALVPLDFRQVRCVWYSMAIPKGASQNSPAFILQSWLEDGVRKSDMTSVFS